MPPKNSMMRFVARSSLAVFGFALLNVAGCADMQTWWDDTFGPKKPAPTRTADAPEERKGVEIAREDGSPPTEAETKPAASGEESPEDIEERIRKYVQQFPEENAGANTTATPSEPATASTNTGAPDTVAPANTSPVTTADRTRTEPPGNEPPAPPVLRSVSVDESISPQPASVEPASADPNVNREARIPAQVQETGLQAQIAELERRVAEQPNDAELQMRLRMLYLATGQDEKASAPVSGVSKEMADMLAGLMDVVQASRNAAKHPDTQADALLDAIDSYRDQIKRHADLRVPNVALCIAADSFGVYKPYPPEQLVAGSEKLDVVVYCEIANFASQKTPEGNFRTRLASQVEVLDADGRSVATLSRKQFEDLSRNQREDFFLGEVVKLPSSLDPGEYTLRVMIEDRGSGRFSSGSTRFTLRPSASQGG